MSKCMVLNDASLPFTSIDECKSNLNIFFRILNRAHLEGISFYQPTENESSWSSLIYAEGFEFSQWINNILEREHRSLVKNVLSKVKCPKISSEYAEVKNSADKVLHILSADRDIEVQGLGIASMMNIHGISFASHENWKSNPISIIRQWDENGMVTEKAIDVPNVLKIEDLESAIELYRSENQKNRKYLRSLLSENNADFPNLVFCDSALRDLISTSVTNDDFTQVIHVLNRLNNAITNSKNISELIDNSKLDISGESVETMNASKHSRKRIFNHPHNGNSTFEDHIKNFSNGKRMHILTDYAKNKICIGYFGHHLSTVKYPK